jgi:DNA-binding response OmpR family regulator
MPRHVLVVDHDRITLEAVYVLLRRAKYQVLCCQCGTDAATRATVFKPDVVIIDVKLADMAGVSI